MLQYFYTNILFKYTFLIFIAFLGVFTFLAYNATKVQIDASAETLLLENDKDLQFTRTINTRYNNQNILVLSYSPQNDLLSNNTLKDIKSISNKLEKLPLVKSTTSILNVPLLQSPVLKLADLTKNINTLSNNKDINKTLVKNEFLNSVLYKNQLVSSDFKTTAIIINLKEDKEYLDLIHKRNKLENAQNINQINAILKSKRDLINQHNHQNISQIRNIIAQHSKNASIFLGGIDMITDDIITYVKNDLKIYGLVLLFILAFVLFIIFKNIVWVILPLFISFLSVIATSGILGLFTWEITVISSNFIAMQLIITLSIVLHLIVRYNELAKKYTNSSQKKLVLNTVLSKINPSFFAIITTVAGFSSLVFSNIQPVINLGYMMSVGIFLSLFISFIIFPLILINMQKITNQKTQHITILSKLIKFTQNIVLHKSNKLFIVAITLVVIGIIGSSKLIVENSFISYFKKDTAIYQGMQVIDTKLGGTTPLDIILTFKEQEKSITEEEDSFLDEFEEEENNEQYWFTKEKMTKILQIHDYLDSLNEIGSVQSFASILKVAKIINDNEHLDSFKLAVLYNKLPNNYRELILNPYVNIQNNQVRFSVRIIDSNPDLRRNELLKKIQKDLSQLVKDDTIQLSNVMVLYNNMLQSLFNSQITTLGFVVVILFIMFLVLFKSFKIAFISIIANIIPILIVFSLMGFLQIPLDIMTITIAAISIGIGVDDTIHYVHRYKLEYQKDKSYELAMKRTHNSIGNAMTFTSITVILGFLVLVFSNLVPTIYFGLLTVFVMISILSSALILLPKMLIVFKVFSNK
jgi:predicted RND superfamily exporter protein